MSKVTGRDYEPYSSEHYAAAQAVQEGNATIHPETALWMTQPYPHGHEKYIPDVVELMYPHTTTRLLGETPSDKPEELKLFYFWSRYDESYVIAAFSKDEAIELYKGAGKGEEFPQDFDDCVDDVFEVSFPKTPGVLFTGPNNKKKGS